MQKNETNPIKAVHRTESMENWVANKSSQDTMKTGKVVYEKGNTMAKPLFQLQAHQATFKAELIAGFTTFLTMACIIFVNPDILAEAGMDKSALISILSVLYFYV